MIPTNNGSSAPCDPISSNCVIWQGPDIPCINLCNGDTISEVIAKLAQELCDIIEATCDCNPDLAELSLQCIPPPAQENPNLAQYLNSIIDYICKIPTGADTIVVELPDCLHYNNSQGNPVTALPIDEYALYLANTICDILDAITLINTQIQQLIERIVVLENCVLPCNPSSGGDPQVISSCIIKGGQPGPASVLLLALESAFCQHVQLVGSNTQLQSAISAQCISGTMLNLTTGVSYGSSKNWVVNASTLAEGHQNQWAVICDLYNAVSDIQQNCCDSGCDGVNILFTQQTNVDAATGAATSITFNFTASTIPQGFTDCGSSINLTDAVGNTLSTQINVVGLAQDINGVTIQLTGLDNTAPINAEIVTCVSDQTETCTDKFSNSIPLNIPCPTVFNVVTAGDVVEFQWSNALGNTVTYDWSASYVQTGAVIASGTINNPGTNLSASIGNGVLTPGLTVEFTVVITNASGGSVTCVLGTYDVPGVNCTSTLYTGTSKDTTLTGTDIFLGSAFTGDSKKPYWFDPINNEIKEPSSESGSGYCKNPKLNWDTTVSANGSFDVVIESRNGTPNDITLAWSADLLNWTTVGTYSPPFPTTVTINTGIASGSIYVRAIENCIPIGLFPSKPTTLRYDFNTNEQSIFSDNENCPNLLGSAGNPLACPSGEIVAKGTISCDSVDYNVPGTAALSRSVWSYVGKYQAQANDPVYYVYSAWTEQGECTGVLMCCECPAFIMPWKINKQLQVAVGGTTTFNLPYLIGDGTPTISVITNPICGSLTQSATFNNQFTYTQNGSNACLSDTITFEISTVVAGDCSSSTITVPIFIQGKQTPPDRGDVNVVVNTSSFATSEAAAVKSVVDKLAAEIKSACPDWDAAGYDVNLIPVNDSAWLGYGKMFVDSGASASLNPAPAWTAVQNLPSYWSGGAVPSSCFIIVLSNGSSPEYHDPTLLQGWGAFPNQQPTQAYLTNYDEHIDILTGTEKSTFGQNQAFDGTPPFEDGYEIALLPITMDQQNLTASNILQMFGAYAGRLINPNEYGITTDPDLAHFMMQGLANYMPYTGAQTQAGTAVLGLRDSNVLAYFDQPGEASMPLTLQAIAAGTDQGSWVDKGVTLFKGGHDGCPDPVDPPVPTDKYWELQEYDAECNKIDTLITIKEDPAKPLAIGDVVKTQGAGGKEQCHEVIQEKEAGTDQAYTKETDCVTCTNDLE